MKFKSLTSPKVIVPVLIVTLFVTVFILGSCPRISIVPDSGKVNAGESISTHVTVTNSWGGMVTLSASGQPQGVLVSFKPKTWYIFVIRESWGRVKIIPFESTAIITTDPSTETGV